MNSPEDEIKSLVTDSPFELLAENGDSLVAENGDNFVIFRLDELVTATGEVSVTGSATVSSYFTHRYTGLGSIAISGSAIINRYPRFSFIGTGFVGLGGDSECFYRIRREYNPNGDIINSSGISLSFIRKYDFISSGEIYITNWSPDNQWLSFRKFVCRFIYRPDADIVIQINETTSEPIFRTIYRSTAVLVSSGISFATSIRKYNATGTITLSSRPVSSRTRFVFDVAECNISVEGELDNSKYLAIYPSLLQINLSNVLDRKLIYYFKPKDAIYSNLAFDTELEFSGIGTKALFNVTGTTSGSSIWGTDIYTFDSDLGLIAVHSGILKNGENGDIIVETIPEIVNYIGSTRNEISSKNWNRNLFNKSIIAYNLPIRISGSSIGNYTLTLDSESAIIQASGTAQLVFRCVQVLENPEISLSGDSYSKYSNWFICKLELAGYPEIKLSYYNDISGDVILSNVFYGGSTSIDPILSIVGSSNSLVIRKFDSLVYLNLSSSIEFTKNRYWHDPEGSLVEVVCDNIYNSFEAFYNFDLNSNWIVGGNGLPDFVLDFSSQWNVYSENYYWYRVIFCGNAEDIISTCDQVYLQNTESPIHTKKLYRTNTPPEDEFISSLARSRPSSSCRSLYQNHSVNPSCGPTGMSLITGVLARNISEVCQILKNPRVGPPPNDRCFKLLSIKKYIQPVDEDGNPIYSDLVDVEFCNSPDCLEFCIDFDFSKSVDVDPCNNSFEFDMFVAQNIFSFPPQVGYQPSSISLFGSSDALMFWFESEGKEIIIIGTENEIVSSRHDYEFLLNLEIKDISNYSPDPVPILLENNQNLLLEQIFDTIDLESSLYETDEGTLDLREIQTVTVNNIILPFEALFEISGSGLLIYKNWSHIAQNNNVYIVGNNNFYARISYTGNPFYAYFKVQGAAEYIYRRSYEHAPKGNIILYSETEIVSSRIEYIPNSIINIPLITTQIISAYRTHTAEGEIKVSSKEGRVGLLAIACNDLCLIEINGSSESKYTHLVSEPNYLTLDGIAETMSPYYNYDAILRTQAQSLSTFYSNQIILGLFVSEIESFSEVSEVSFDSITINSDISIDESRINTCGCLSLNRNLSLSHNMAFSGVFSNFLFRNNYSIPSTINLRYNNNQNSWSSNFRFRGRGVEQNNTEDWLLMFKLSCNNIIDGNEIDNFYLKFNFFARRINLSSNINWITNLSTNIIPESVCQNGNLSTRIAYNIPARSIFIDDIFSPLSTVLDNIGMFKNNYWNDNVNCKGARKDKLGKGRRDGFLYCGITGPFPEFKINYPENPVLVKIQTPVVEQIIL